MYLAFPTGIYTCSKSIIKRERHCAKYAQCWRERHQIKCWKLSFYKYACFLLFWLLSTLWIYHFYCYSTSFLPLYSSIATLIPHIFWISTQIPSILTLICVPHFHHILDFPILILRISLISFPNSPFWPPQIDCSVCNLEEFILRK